jgi:chemotaxis protein MotB
MLSTLLLVVTFLMSFFMPRAISSPSRPAQDTMLSRLNRQLSQLTELLALNAPRTNLPRTASRHCATLVDKEKETARLTGMMGEQGGKTDSAEAKATQLGGELDQQKQITNDALAKVEILNQQLAALRLQIASLQEALDASEAKDKDSQTRIADLGQRLNVALAKKVQELARYRSDFFGKLRGARHRADFQVVGDRFVFPSDVLSDSGSAVLKSGATDQLTSLPAP